MEFGALILVVGVPSDILTDFTTCLLCSDFYLCKSFLLTDFTNLRQSYREKETEGVFVYWLTPQMSTIARVGLDRCQEPVGHSSSPLGVAGTTVLGPSPAASQDAHAQKAEGRGAVRT